jgi:6-phosphofructokinase 1
MIKKMAVLTSGGDSPGMNACIRAVVRTAHYNNIEVIGFLRGYEGLIDNSFIELKNHSVSGIIQRGGTILKTARSARFMTSEGINLAVKHLQLNKVDGLVIIGGDGSFKGAIELSKLLSIPIIGCPGTIDNDLVGTDFTIGYDTAINTVVEAIDKIRDTAESHDRVFVIEVMGRDAGLIAVRSAVASGAEAVLVPEIKNDLPKLIERMKNWRATKSSKIIVVAEGDESGGAYKVADNIKQNFPELDMRVSILGHVQRGGNPTCMERVNASLMGYSSVMALIEGRRNEMTGIINKTVCFTPFQQVVKHIEQLDPVLEKMIEVLGS